MLRTLATTAILTAAAMAIAAVPQNGPLGSHELAGRTTRLDDVSPCDNLWDREPLVLYDVMGSTLVGHVQMHVAIYNDGSVSLSEAVPFSGTLRVENANVGADKARALLAELTSEGAFELCDQQTQATDVPLTSVTVFRGRMAHNFNYWIGAYEHAAVHTALTGFIQATFPEQ